MSEISNSVSKITNAARRATYADKSPVFRLSADSDHTELIHVAV